MPTCIIPLKEYFILTFRFERWIFRFGHYILTVFYLNGLETNRP